MFNVKQDTQRTTYYKKRRKTATMFEESNAEASERLRLEGNKAFGEGDFEKAIELYRSSNQHQEQAKVYTNLATALFQLRRFDEAKTAAERGTVVDPTWTKAWWRLGKVAEELQDFILAHSCFSKAVNLSPTDKGCRNSLSAIEGKLGIQETTPNGTPIMTNLRGTTNNIRSPGYASWVEALVLVEGGSTFKVIEKYQQKCGEHFPTSRQYLVKGMSEWVNGLKRAIGSLALTISPQAKTAFFALRDQRLSLSDEEFDLRCDRLMGGLPDGRALEGLVGGYSHLGGAHVLLEGVQPADTPRLCPPGKFLSNVGNYQSLSLLWAIETGLNELIRRYGFSGPTLICSKAILQASAAVWANLPGANRPNLQINPQQAPTPEEVLDFIKEQLRAGKTWEEGLQQYFALQYRGTVAFAAFMRLLGQPAHCYEHLKWARELVALADAEFQVSKERSYAQKGSAFVPNIRAGLMRAELYTLIMLRGNRLDGPYTVGDTFDLCLEIMHLVYEIADAENLHDGLGASEEDDYTSTLTKVTSVRKPLAFAHSVMASHLELMRSMTPAELFTEQMHNMGQIDGPVEAGCDPFQIIAKHYRLAAENELPDDDQGAIYWWAYGSNMAQAAESSGFTLGDLLHALSMAEAAEQARDVGLWGANEQKGGTHEAITRLTLQYYQDESDAFVLPQVNRVKHGEGENAFFSLRVDDNTIICDDFSEYQEVDAGYYKG